MWSGEHLKGMTSSRDPDQSRHQQRRTRLDCSHDDAEDGRNYSSALDFVNLSVDHSSRRNPSPMGVDELGCEFHQEQYGFNEFDKNEVTKQHNNDQLEQSTDDTESDSDGLSFPSSGCEEGDDEADIDTDTYTNAPPPSSFASPVSVWVDDGRQRPVVRPSLSMGAGGAPSADVRRTPPRHRRVPSAESSPFGLRHRDYYHQNVTHFPRDLPLGSASPHSCPGDLSILPAQQPCHHHARKNSRIGRSLWRTSPSRRSTQLLCAEDATDTIYFRDGSNGEATAKQQQQPYLPFLPGGSADDLENNLLPPLPPFPPTKKKQQRRRNVFLLAALVAWGIFSYFALSRFIDRFVRWCHRPGAELQRLRLEEGEAILRRIRARKRHSRDEQFTLRIVATNNDRTDLILHSIDAHARCPSVRNIEVDWRDDGVRRSAKVGVPGSIRDHGSGKVLVTNNLAGNGSGFTNAATDAVLLLGDDVVFTCEELDRAFNVWSKNPDRMVGFFPYSHKRERQTQGEGGSEPQRNLVHSVDDQSWELEEVPRGAGSYTLLSDRAAFVHKLYLNTVHFGDLSRQDEATDPCATVALSIRVTSMSSKPPLAIAADPFELRSSGVSRTVSHLESQNRRRRSHLCLADRMTELDLVDLPWEELTYVGEGGTV